MAELVDLGPLDCADFECGNSAWVILRDQHGGKRGTYCGYHGALPLKLLEAAEAVDNRATTTSRCPRCGGSGICPC